MQLFVVYSKESILGVFADRAVAEDFKERAYEVLGGADVSVGEGRLNAGLVQNPYSGKRHEVSADSTGEVAVLKIDPGDTLVIMYPEVLSARAAENIDKDLRDRFPNTNIMVLDGGAKLAVVKGGVK